jgi:hypothetical protein
VDAAATAGESARVVDLVFVARAVPRNGDLFWPALEASGLTRRPCPPGDLARLREEGLELLLIPLERIGREEIDRDAAVERAREALSQSVERLERRVSELGARLVVFLGSGLHAAALGPRISPEDGEGGVRFGGGVALAVPQVSRLVTPALFLERMRRVARLRREVSQRTEGAGAP